MLRIGKSGIFQNLSMALFIPRMLNIKSTNNVFSIAGTETALVGSSITSSVNIFLRAALCAIATLTCMFCISWQLSLLALVTIPTAILLSKWYGSYIRIVARIQQKKVRKVNCVGNARRLYLLISRFFPSSLHPAIQSVKQQLLPFRQSKLLEPNSASLRSREF